MAKRKKAPASDAVKKKKAVTVSLLKRVDDKRQTPMPYKMLASLIADHHEHLMEANIAIAWRMSAVRADADGLVEFGRVKRGSDLDRALSEFDFVLIIAHEVWHRAETDEQQMLAILDWLLCHCQAAMAGDEQAVNEDDKLVWRLRKPLRVFPENVGRFGLWNAEKIDDAIRVFNDRARPLLPADGSNGAAGANGLAAHEPDAVAAPAGAGS